MLEKRQLRGWRIPCAYFLSNLVTASTFEASAASTPSRLQCDAKYEYAAHEGGLILVTVGTCGTLRQSPKPGFKTPRASATTARCARLTMLQRTVLQTQNSARFVRGKILDRWSPLQIENLLLRIKENHPEAKLQAPKPPHVLA